MKVLRLLFFALAATSVAAAADAPSLTGKWNVHTSIAGNESDALCTFTETAAELAGTCSSNAGSFETHGKVDGTKVSWSYQMPYNGAPLTLVFEGTVDGSAKISGTVSIPEYSASGDFMATQAK